MKRYLVALAVLVVSTSSHAAVDLSTIWAEIDISTVAASIVGIGVLAVGVNLGLKAMSISKSAINRL